MFMIIDKDIIIVFNGISWKQNPSLEVEGTPFHCSKINVMSIN